MSNHPRINIVLGAVAASLAIAAPAAAEDAPQALWDRDFLTGDWGGLRPQLVDKGITLGLKYTGEAFNDARGGLRTGTRYEDQILLTTDFNLEKLAGWTGATIHASGLNADGRGPQHDLTGNALLPSNNEVVAQRQVRLWTLWFQQTAFDDMLSVRAGQLTADEEFMVAPTAGNLMAATFGFNALGFENLALGGPVYPAGAPGARVQISPNENIAWLTGVFSHLPESPFHGGTDFKWTGGSYVISELQYLSNQGKDATGLPAMYKIGGWYDTGKFADQHLNTDGRSLALFGGTAQQHRGTGSIYGTMDQTLWNGGSQAISMFLRGGIDPDKSVALVDWYVDGGLGYKGLIPGRRDDMLTFGFAYANVGNGARDFDRDAKTTVRDYETVLELNYLVQMAPWWTIQPDVQYIIHPAFHQVGLMPASAPPTASIPNAVLFGLRTTFVF